MSETQLFDAAVKLLPTERATYLDQACADDPAVRARIEALLRAHDQAGHMLDQPALEQTGAYVPKSEPDAQARPGTLIAGRYKLLEQIGEGGMGTVWVAEQTQPVKRKVALKLIKAGMDSKSVLARFEAERQALAVMDHPNVAKVLDGGTTENGRPYFVMEYVKGVPLTKYCDDARLSIPQRLALFVPVCQAVQHAHQKGIIHRDLKPSNILICLYDGVPVPKVIDFGLAKAMHQSLTEHTLHTAHGTMMGTPLYMSPEQAEFNNLDVDTRTDIYALGVILYELLTGTTPLEKQQFQKAAWHEMLRLIKEEEPPKPSARLSGSGSLPSVAAQRQLEPLKLTKLVRGELDWIVMKALEKDRNRRYETANGFAMDVQRYLAGEPVLAAPPSTSYRLRKFAHKHRTALTTTVVIALLLVTGAAVSTWLAMWAMQAERAARQAQKAEAERADGEKQAKQDAQAAAAAETIAKEQAQKRLAQIQKGIEIITAIFMDLDIRRLKKDREPLEAVLAKRLVNAAKQLEGEAVGDPLVVAELQSRLGRSLMSLGHPRQALPLFVKSLETYKAKQAADHPDTLGAMSNLGLCYQIVGRLDLAVPLCEQALKLMTAQLGPADVRTIACMNNLALCYREVGKPALALPLHVKVLELRMAVLGAENIETLNAMHNLAGGYHALGDFTAAIPYYLETIQLMKSKLGLDHHDTLLCMANLAACYCDAKKLDLALPLFEETLKLTTANLGADHTLTISCMNSLAVGYKRVGRIEEAIPLYRESLRLLRIRLGDNHHYTLTSLTNLASAYCYAGKPEQALPFAQEAATGIEKQQFRYEGAGDIVNTMIACCEQLKRFAEAEAWRRKWLAVVKQRAGAESAAYSEGLAGLARTVLQQSKWTEAESLAREYLHLRRGVFPGQWLDDHVMTLLGGALLGQKKYAEAEPVLLQGYERLKQRADKIPPQYKARLTEALERLVQLYEVMDKKDDAAKWRKEMAVIKSIIAPKEKER